MPQPAPPEALAARLCETVASYGSVAVALSGGVDSAVVATAAVKALDTAAVAVTAHSPSVAMRERVDAAALAARIGIRHVVIETGEFGSADYAANRGDRCFHCKSTLYAAMADWCGTAGYTTLCNGTNIDDLGDYRPGLRAADDFAVRSPLVEIGATKPEVRAIAALWNLPIADKPASPCLSSRIAVGVDATPARVAMIEAAETRVRDLVGDVPLRVRLEAGDLARIEVPTERLAMLIAPSVRTDLSRELKALGFRAVTLDLEGFRSGSLNDLIPLDVQAAATAIGA